MKNLFIISLLIFLTQEIYSQDINISYDISRYQGGNNVTCHGSSDGWINPVVVGGTAPYYFSWSNGSYNQNLSNISAGVYTVTVTDANGSTGSKTITLLEAKALSILLHPQEHEGGYNISRNGGSDGYIESEIRGGTSDYNYLWSTSATDIAIRELTANTYTLTVTDMNGCTASKSVTLVEPTPLHVISINSPMHHGYNVSCKDGKDGAINLSVTGGASLTYSYQWSNGFTEQNPVGLPAGHYSVIITDISRTSITAQIDLSEPPGFKVNNMASTIYPNGKNLSCYTCANGSITANTMGGVTPVTYQWMDNGPTTQTYSNLNAGNYYVTVTDGNGCTSSASKNIVGPDRDDWSMMGNTGTDPSTQFMGTTDYKDFTIRTNNSVSMKLSKDGQVVFPGLSPVGTTDTKMLFVTPNGTITIGPPFDYAGLNNYVNGCHNFPITTPWQKATTVGPNGAYDIINCHNRFGFGVINPQERVQIAGNARFSTAINNTTNYLNVGYDNGSKINSYGTDLIINGISSANVGIGTNAPDAKLDVNGNIRINNNILYLRGNGDNNHGLAYNGLNSVTDIDGPVLFGWEGGALGSHNTSTGDNIALSWNSLGCVAIGTTNFNGTWPGTYKLAVEGKIIAEDFMVQLRQDWPDYVFESDFKLMSLYDVKKFVNQYHHLPGIPRASDVECSEIGIGEMQNMQMQKIEELTLYLIQLKQEIDELKKENAEIKSTLK